MERTFAWPGHERRLLVRHERLPEVYHAFLTIACARIVVQALLRLASAGLAATLPPTQH